LGLSPGTTRSSPWIVADRKVGAWYGRAHLRTDAEDINALLEQLKLDHVKVLGWSDGGIIGLLLTIHHPDKVSMLAVMGANLEPDAPTHGR